MSASMPEGQRKQAMESLKSACERFMEIDRAIDQTMNERERKRVEKKRRKARELIVERWERFPECYGDGQSGNVPSAKEILAIIARQEAAIAWAASVSLQVAWDRSLAS
jgi:hypothetical protein